MSTYIQVNKDAAIYRRDTNKISLAKLSELLKEEVEPATVRQPDNYPANLHLEK